MSHCINAKVGGSGIKGNFIGLKCFCLKCVNMVSAIKMEKKEMERGGIHRILVPCLPALEKAVLPQILLRNNGCLNIALKSHYPMRSS